MSTQCHDFSNMTHGITFTEAQNEAIATLATSRTKVLALQAGMGKSLVSLTAMKAIRAKNPESVGVIISPKSARAAFKKEISNRLGEQYAIYSAEEVIPFRHQPYLIVEQSVLQRNVSLIKQVSQWHPIVAAVDEAHVLQNPKNGVSRTLTDLQPYFAAEWLVSATPLLNSIEGLYWFCHHIDKRLPSWWEFRSKFCELKPRELRVRGGKRTIQDIVGYKNLDLLEKYLRQIMIIGSIPYNLKYHYVAVEMEDFIKHAYNEASKGVFDHEYVGEKEFGARLHDLQRVVDGSHHSFGNMEVTSKEKALLMTVKKIMDRNESCLIYMEYEDTIDRLAKQVSRYAKWAGVRNIYLLTGSQKEDERAAIEKVMGRRDVVIMSSAGKQSRNLQAANHLILYNVPFSVGTCIQCLGRICRIDSVYKEQWVHIIESKNSIDTYKKALFLDNVALINRLFGNMGVLPTETFSIDRDNMTRLKRQYLWNRRK